MIITFNYKDGTATITLDDVKRAIKKNNTGSDLDCLGAPKGVLIGLPFELFVNIFRKLHVGVQLFSVLKLWIEGFFPYYNIWRFL